MTHTIAMVPYLNMLPLRMNGAPQGCELRLLDPRETVNALATGEVAAAVVPVGGLPSLAGVVQPLGPWGIAADGVVGSVLFFSQRPFSGYGSEHRIRVTRESATSVKLLALLLGYENGFDNLPHLADADEEPDGELLIGDQALDRLQQASAPYVVDLSGAWRQHHGLPFVFARWVIRNDAPAELRDNLLCWLVESDRKHAQLIEASLLPGAQQTSLSPQAVRSYLHKIGYRIDMRHQQAQGLFESEVARHLSEPPFWVCGPHRAHGARQ